MNQDDKNAVASHLNGIGKGFCLAKWYELDLDLSSGKNRSCDLVQSHSIPIDDVRSNLNLFHNTEYKKLQRFFMLEGIQPKECKACWAHESTSKKPSPRIQKSIEFYSKQTVDNILKNKHEHNYYPKKLKLIFSRNCNFKCTYCGPEYSSAWAEDIFKNGSFPIGSSRYDLKFLETDTVYFDQSDNPYIEYFWLWFVKASNNLQELYITGGEPLMDRNFFRIIEYFVRNPNQSLTIKVESNVNPAGQRWDGFISLLRKISKNTKKIVLYSSIDCWGPQAEYARHGLNIDRFKKNILKFLKSSNTKELNFKINFNCLSYESFFDLMNEILNLRKRFVCKEKIIKFQISVCRDPEFFHPGIFKDLIFFLEDVLKFMKCNLETTGNKNIGFSLDEIEMILNLKQEILNKECLPNTEIEFMNFINEFDKRNNVRFQEIFPVTYEHAIKKFKYDTLGN